jgi:hypothetical protein
MAEMPEKRQKYDMTGFGLPLGVEDILENSKYHTSV